jgi:hypothetical protein
MRLRAIRAASFEAVEDCLRVASGGVGRQTIHRAEVMRAAVVGCAIKIAGGILDQA